VVTADRVTLTDVDFDPIAAPPPPSRPLVIASIKPQTIKRGARTTIVIKGTGLSPMGSAALTGDGVKRLAVKADSTDTRLRLLVVVAPTAVTGQRTLTLQRADGVSIAVPIVIA